MLRSHIDIHERLQLGDERLYAEPQRCLLLLTQHLPSPPRCSHMLAGPQTMQCTEKEEQKGPFHPLYRSLLVGFWFSMWEGTSVCSSPLQTVLWASHPSPLCSLGSQPRGAPGRASPRQFLSGYHRQGMDYPGLGMDYREGEVRGSLCQSCRAHAVKTLCARRESPAGRGGVQCGKRERPALRHATQLRQCVTAFKEKKKKEKETPSLQQDFRQSSCLVWLQW